MDYAVSLLSCPASAGRFQATSSPTVALILTDTALGDVYVWRGEKGWLKYPSPLRKPVSSFGVNDSPATNP